MITINKTTRTDTQLFDCPVKGLQNIRKMYKSGKPLPKTILLHDPQSERVVSNLVSRMRRLYGTASPMLVVLPAA